MPDSITEAAGVVPARRRSALSGIIRPGLHGANDYRGPGLLITERHPLSMVQIEAHRPEVAGMLEASKSVLGLRPPQAPNTSAGDGRPRVLWTGPNRWLVVEPEIRDLNELLQDALAPLDPASLVQASPHGGAAVVDLGHGRASFRLAGRSVRQVLMKGAGLDWHVSAFMPGMCAQTTMFHLSALIDCRDESTFDIYVARGFALSFLENLTQAAAEYGYRLS
jgi:sarcosine oxidase subunit gamma